LSPGRESSHCRNESLRSSAQLDAAHLSYSLALRATALRRSTPDEVCAGTPLPVHFVI
jgi:hypothetical protein